jgi:hypothetical protein
LLGRLVHCCDSQANRESGMIVLEAHQTALHACASLSIARILLVLWYGDGLMRLYDPHGVLWRNFQRIPGVIDRSCLCRLVPSLGDERHTVIVRPQSKPSRKPDTFQIVHMPLILNALFYGSDEKIVHERPGCALSSPPPKVRLSAVPCSSRPGCCVACESLGSSQCDEESTPHTQPHDLLSSI